MSDVVRHAQVGYYFSAFTVDKLWMGRVRLQSMVRTSCQQPLSFDDTQAAWDDAIQAPLPTCQLSAALNLPIAAMGRSGSSCMVCVMVC